MTTIFDLESNDLYYEATEIHCISLKTDDKPTEVYTSRPLRGSQGTIEDALRLLGQADLIVGHNVLNFDIPLIKKLYPKWEYKECLDTLILSKLSNPNLASKDMYRKSVPPKLKGRHSLKAWGYRLRKLKGDFAETNDWSRLTPDMADYCKQDVEVTHALYHKLRLSDTPAEAIWLEHEFAKIIDRQEKYGVYFDVKSARQLHIELLSEVDAAEKELFNVFKPLQTWTPKSYPRIAIKKDGSKSAVLLSQEAMGCRYIDGVWGYYKTVGFNPSSRQHIARWLMDVYDWRPTEFTEKNTVTINEGVLSTLDFPQGKILSHYFAVTKLIGMVAEGKNAWLKKVSNDSRIHGRVDTLGAVSRRCTHSSPNLAQVPSSRSYKGMETRMLFRAPKGKKIVGCDADGLELRTLSHYMARFDGGAYARAVDSGDKSKGTDIHTLNQKAAGLPTRDDAKTFIYAFLYGAGDAKIGEIVGGTAEDGKRLKASFFRKIPAIQDLVRQVGEAYKATGTLKALDANKFHIRAAHSALNTLLQGAGALVMKYYLVFADRQLKSHFETGVQYEFVLNIHDEVQVECDSDIAEKVAEILEKAFEEVTSYLKFRIPLRGTAVVGNSWADTH